MSRIRAVFFIALVVMVMATIIQGVFAGVSALAATVMFAAAWKLLIAGWAGQQPGPAGRD